MICRNKVALYRTSSDRYLKTLAVPLSELPAAEQAELEALHHLSDDAVCTIAGEQMPDDVQMRAHWLLNKSTLGTLTDEEQAKLEQLDERGDWLMLGSPGKHVG